MHEDPVDNENDDARQEGEIELFGFTIASEPPKTQRPQRRSWWADVFAEAREYPGEWRVVVMAFAESTAKQLASDVRNAHKREPKKMRLRGLVAGERWDAECAPAPKESWDAFPQKEPYWLWLCFCGAGSDDQ